MSDTATRETVTAAETVLAGAWQPPPRPESVQRLVEEGECMDIRGVVPLDENSLVESAQRATGLSDFGADDWHEPFQVYVKALDEEADFNLLGRLRARQEGCCSSRGGCRSRTGTSATPRSTTRRSSRRSS